MINSLIEEAVLRERLYFEDFFPGQMFRAGPYHVTRERIVDFARTFDPQPFHLDPELATASFFRGLAASGWHTAAITMRLLVDGGLPIMGGIVGTGIDELRWLKPVRPGDMLSLDTEILDLQPSSRLAQGRMRARTITRDQQGDAVQSLVASLIVPRRPLPPA